jgi:hypothetical protein
MIKIAEAIERVGERVVFERPFCHTEYGEITSVSLDAVFVRYDRQPRDAPGEGTDPIDLRFVRDL